MNLNSFIGNYHIKNQLSALFCQKKFPHAILLEGEKGLGKRTLAKIIAQAAVCENLEEDLACETCASCQKVEKEIHPDVIYPEKTGVMQSYSITTVRKIRVDAYVAPNESSRKVYIFTDADTMGIPAQNALLKVLEEPPQNVIFILTCQSSTNLLATLCSRMLRFAVSTVSQEELQEYFEKNYPKENLENLLSTSNGNIGLLLDLVESTECKIPLEIAKKVAQNLVLAKEFDLLKIMVPIFENRKIFIAFLNFLSVFFRDALVFLKKVTIEDENDVKMLSERLTVQQILNIIDAINETRRHAENNVNLSILTTSFCSNLYNIANNR